jgi:hypothetical protein
VSLPMSAPETVGRGPIASPSRPAGAPAAAAARPPAGRRIFRPSRRAPPPSTSEAIPRKPMRCSRAFRTGSTAPASKV